MRLPVKVFWVWNGDEWHLAVESGGHWHHVAINTRSELQGITVGPVAATISDPPNYRPAPGKPVTH